MSKLEMAIYTDLDNKFIAGEDMTAEELEMLAILMKKYYNIG